MKSKISALLGLALLVTSCAPAATTVPPTAAALTKVTLMLDWVPNVNHTGLFVARDNGYFKDAGLDVNIIQPGEVYAEQAVVSGAADFGVSFEEQVTLTRAKDGTPLVSLAAILQHNTSGFAARGGEGVKTAKDWAGLKYGSFGSPFEPPTLQALMECAGGDYSKLQSVDAGATDPLALLTQKKIDLTWIFYGTQGVQAEKQGVKLDVVMLSDHTDCIPDYYTPILITSEKLIAERPAVAKAFMQAVSRGYAYAIANPDQAAEILQKAAPETDLATLKAQQAWLSPRYQAEAPRWGEQKLSVWQGYADWMLKQGLIPQKLDAPKAFTNDFLP